jgi:hypothetical protein
MKSYECMATMKINSRDYLNFEFEFSVLKYKLKNELIEFSCTQNWNILYCSTIIILQFLVINVAWHFVDEINE